MERKSESQREEHHSGKAWRTAGPGRARTGLSRQALEKRRKRLKAPLTYLRLSIMAFKSFSGLHNSNACPTRSRLASINLGNAAIAAWKDRRTEVAARRRSDSHRWRYGRWVEMVSSRERLRRGRRFSHENVDNVESQSDREELRDRKAQTVSRRRPASMEALTARTLTDSPQAIQNHHFAFILFFSDLSVLLCLFVLFETRLRSDDVREEGGEPVLGGKWRRRMVGCRVARAQTAREVSPLIARPFI